MIQWLGLSPFTAVSLGSSPGQGIELRSQQAAQHGKKKEKKKKISINWENKVPGTLLHGMRDLSFPTKD